MSRFTFITLISVISLLIAFILTHQKQEDEIAEAAKLAEFSEPDFYMTNTTSIEYGLDGKIRYRFQAADLKHYPEGDITLISNPEMTLYGKGDPWHINSLKGRISEEGKVITLTENVRLRSGTPQEPLQIKTQTLTILPDKNLAKTNQKVLIENKSGQMTATGMNAYIDDNRMELLSNVQVQHNPLKAK